MTAEIETFKPRTRRGLELGTIVEALRHGREVTHNIRHGGKVQELPSPAAIRDIVDNIATALFPTHLGPQGLNPEGVDLFVANTLATTLPRLQDQVARGLAFGAKGPASGEATSTAAEDIVQRFAEGLPRIRDALVSDLRIAQQRDPEAESLGELLICDRTLTALLHYRLAHALNRNGARLVARIISRIGFATTGIDLDPAQPLNPPA